MECPGGRTWGAALAYVAALAAGCAPGDDSAGSHGSDGSDGYEPTLPAAPDELHTELRALVEEHVQRVRVAPGRARAQSRAHGTLGLVYQANGLWPEARECFEKAAALHPKTPTWPSHLATALREVGDPAAGLAVLREAAERFPNQAPLHHRLGLAALDHGDFETAERAFERTVALAPEAFDGHVGRAAVRLELEDVDGAIEAARRALEIRPNAREAHYLLGLALRRDGQLEEAQLELARGTGGQLKPMPDEGTAALAQLAVGAERDRAHASKLMRTWRADEAIAILEPLHESKPDDLRVALDLGVAYSRAGRTRDALAVFDAAEELDPDSHLVHLNVAACWLDLGRAGKALTRARRAVELAPGEAHAHLLEGRALLALERPEEARDVLERARELGADPDIAAALEEARAAVAARAGRTERP